MKRIITICIIMSLSVISTYGAVINVPDDYSTIQAAITAAVSNDTVQVAAGTYTENIVLKSGITLLGAGADMTVIQGNGDRVITAIGAQDTEIDGFTITGGVSGDLGGGILCYDDSFMTVCNCVISNNVANYGGGIHCQESRLILINTTISGNSAAYIGGGIYFVDTQPDPQIDPDPIIGDILPTPQPIIANSQIIGNTAQAQNGGGIACYNSSPTIVKTEISGNSAGTNGGGIDCSYYSDPWLTKSIVSYNTAILGGGINCQWVSWPSLTSCVIAHNAAQEGGAIYCNFNSSPSIGWATIVYNSAVHGGGILCVEPDTDYLLYCILWGNGDDLDGIGAQYSCIEDGDPGSGNIADDPLFMDAMEGNYRLSMLSPCINVRIQKSVAAIPMGVPDELKYLFVPVSDQDLNPRIVNYSTDMGAYEFQGSIAVSPAQHDFGDVEVEKSSTAIFTVSSLRKDGPVQLPDIGLNSLSGFIITSPDVIPDSLGPGESFDIEITFSPDAAYIGYYTSQLMVIWYNGGVVQPPQLPPINSVVVPLGGMGITIAQARQEQIEEIQTDIGQGVEEGNIVGEGTGSSGDKRINALINMLDAVGDLIVDGEYELAYNQLESLYKKIDGQPNPPDFVSGPGVEDLCLQVEALLEDLLAILSQP